MILGELYRHAGGWKFRALGQGYETGLAAVAADFKLSSDHGVESNRQRTDIPYLSRRRKAAAHPEPMRPSSRSAAPADPGASRRVPRTHVRHQPRSTHFAQYSPVWLTPRCKPGGSGGLTLGASPAPTPSAKASVLRSRSSGPLRPHRTRLFPAPGFGSVRELGEANPVVRLNARQSAVGSLLVTGVRSVAWEDQQLTTGAHHADGHKAGTAVITPGNRPLAGSRTGPARVPAPCPARCVASCSSRARPR